MIVKFFSQLKLHTGCDEVPISLNDSIDAGALWSLLEERFPGILRYQSSTRLALNFDYAGPESLFENGDEVALIPPVSGG